LGEQCWLCIIEAAADRMVSFDGWPKVDPVVNALRTTIASELRSQSWCNLEFALLSLTSNLSTLASMAAFATDRTFVLVLVV
jgi:hypothetical protein